MRIYVDSNRIKNKKCSICTKTLLDKERVYIIKIGDHCQTHCCGCFVPEMRKMGDFLRENGIDGDYLRTSVEIRLNDGKRIVFPSNLKVGQGSLVFKNLTFEGEIIGIYLLPFNKRIVHRINELSPLYVSKGETLVLEFKELSTEDFKYSL